MIISAMEVKKARAVTRELAEQTIVIASMIKHFLTLCMRCPFAWCGIELINLLEVRQAWKLFKLPVLVIADYAKMLQIIGNLLKQLGIRNVDEAFGGITALELLRVKNYSLIIAEDVMAPIGGLM